MVGRIIRKKGTSGRRTQYRKKKNTRRIRYNRRTFKKRAPKIIYVQAAPPAPPAPAAPAPPAPPAPPVQGRQGMFTWGDAGKLLAVDVAAEAIGHEVVKGLDGQ